MNAVGPTDAATISVKRRRHRVERGKCGLFDALIRFLFSYIVREQAFFTMFISFISFGVKVL